MYRAIRRLSCNVIIERIPSYTLNVVVVLGDLSNKLALTLSVEN
jgi:hypothetical protein